MLLVNKFAWIFYRSDILRVVDMGFEVEKYHNWNNYNDQDADSQNYQNLLPKKRILFNTILSPTWFGVTKNSLLDHFLIKKFGNNLKKLYHWIWIFWPYSNLLILCLQKSDTKLSKHRINNESFQINYPVLNENIQSFDWSPIYQH